MSAGPHAQTFLPQFVLEPSAIGHAHALSSQLTTEMIQHFSPRTKKNNREAKKERNETQVAQKEALPSRWIPAAECSRTPKLEGSLLKPGCLRIHLTYPQTLL